MQQFPFPQGDGFGGIASHEVSCRRFVFVLGHDGDRYAEYGRLSGAEASLRTVRALRRPQRALQRPLRHA